MIERIVQQLKQTACDGYTIEEVKTIAYQFFFVAHQLDQNRKKMVNHTTLTVFKKLDDGCLGQASKEICQGSSDEEIKSTIDELLYRCEFVKNQAYALPSKGENQNFTKSFDAMEVVKKLLKVMQGLKENQYAKINSYEIFVNEVNKRFINSNGIDVSYNQLDGEVEVIINGVDQGHEIELYRDYIFGDLDEELLKKQINEVLFLASQRAKAVPTPQLDECKVLLGSDNVKTLMNYFVCGVNARYVYQKISTMKVDEAICDAKGDRICMKGVRFLEHSSRNAAYDGDGNLIQDRVLIKDNIVQAFYGNERFAQYIGCQAGDFKNFIFEGGSRSIEEMKQEPYLECLDFSSFSLDEVTGDYAGEIRLAYYYDGEKVVPVRGGSIAGNILKDMKDWYLSKESSQYNWMSVPSVVELHHAVITGCSE